LKRRFAVCFSFVFLAAVLLVPFSPRSFAQESAPASQAAQPNASSSESKGPSGVTSAEAEKSEKDSEEDPNVFRHSSAVQAIANMLHLDVEVVAKTLEYINFAVVFLAIVIPLVKFLPKAFRGRSQTIQTQLEEARSATEEANSRLGAVEQRLAKLDTEIEAIRRQVEQDSVGDEARIKNSIEEERKRIVESANQEIEAASASARRSLKDFAAELAIDRAMGRLALTPEVDRRLVGEFARELGKEGQN
jgi:F-type H+-transporting ATPase subunit b